MGLANEWWEIQWVFQKPSILSIPTRRESQEPSPWSDSYPSRLLGSDSSSSPSLSSFPRVCRNRRSQRKAHWSLMTPMRLRPCVWSWAHFGVPALGSALHSTYCVQRTAQGSFQSLDISKLKVELQHADSRRRQRCFWFGLCGSLANASMDARLPETSEMVSSNGVEYFLAWRFFFAFYVLILKYVFDSERTLDAWTLMLATGAVYNLYCFCPPTRDQSREIIPV